MDKVYVGEFSELFEKLSVNVDSVVTAIHK